MPSPSSRHWSPPASAAAGGGGGDRRSTSGGLNNRRRRRLVVVLEAPLACLLLYCHFASPPTHEQLLRSSPSTTSPRPRRCGSLAHPRHTTSPWFQAPPASSGRGLFVPANAPSPPAGASGPRFPAAPACKSGNAGSSSPAEREEKKHGANPPLIRHARRHAATRRKTARGSTKHRRRAAKAPARLGRRSAAYSCPRPPLAAPASAAAPPAPPAPQWYPRRPAQPPAAAWACARTSAGVEGGRNTHAFTACSIRLVTPTSP